MPTSRLAQSRVWPALLVPAALLLTAPACTRPPDRVPVVDVLGRPVKLPPPPGMVSAVVGGGKAYPGVPYFHFAPAGLIERSKHGALGPMPYYARANAEPVMNHDDSTAVREFAAKRAEIDARPDPAPGVLQPWQEALRGGLAGGNARLPRPPQGPLLVERVESSPGAVVNLVVTNTGGRLTLIGDALLLVNHRAMWCTVVRQPCETEADLAIVRGEIVSWTRAVRGANAPQ